MMRISDIMEKEIINVKNGKKLGFITDIDLDVENGKVSSFSITGSSGNFFSRGAEIDTVFWRDTQQHMNVVWASLCFYDFYALLFAQLS